VFCENFTKIGLGKLELHGGKDQTLCNVWAIKISAKKQRQNWDRSDSDAHRKPQWTARSDIEAGEGRQAARSRQETAREF